jgi:hypothetical protein
MITRMNPLFILVGYICQACRSTYGQNIPALHLPPGRIEQVACANPLPIARTGDSPSAIPPNYFNYITANYSKFSMS